MQNSGLLFESITPIITETQNVLQELKDEDKIEQSKTIPSILEQKTNGGDINYISEKDAIINNYSKKEEDKKNVKIYPQRSIEFEINKFKFNYFLNGSDEEKNTTDKKVINSNENIENINKTNLEQKYNLENGIFNYKLSCINQKLINEIQPIEKKEIYENLNNSLNLKIESDKNNNEKNNFSNFNHSFDSKDNNQFYKTLNSIRINDEINNSKIMEKDLLSGIKNEERKNSLKNAITAFHLIKSNQLKYQGNEKIVSSPKLNKNNIDDTNENKRMMDNGLQNDINENNNNKSSEINIVESNNSNIIEENEHEFSFNSNNRFDIETNTQPTEIIENKINEEEQQNKINPNINKNNNKYFHIEYNDINEKIDNKKENKKKIENNKPLLFVRRLLREEHYYIDENGEEKLYEIKQKYLKNDKNKYKLNRKINISNLNKIKEKVKKNLYIKLNSNKNKILGTNISKKINKKKNRIKINPIESEILDFPKENYPNNTTRYRDIKTNNILKDVNKYVTKNRQDTNDLENKKLKIYLHKNNTLDEASNTQRIHYISNKIDPKSNLKNKIQIKHDFNIRREKPIILNTKYFDNTLNSVIINQDSQRENFNTNSTLDQKNYSYININYINSSVKGRINSNHNINLGFYNKLKPHKKINLERLLKMNSNRDILVKKAKNQNHVYHEIKMTKTKLCESQKNYLNKDKINKEKSLACMNKRLKLSSRNIERNNKGNEINENNHVNYIFKKNDIKYILNRQQNFINTFNRNNYFMLNSSNDRNTQSREKSNHKYYESKSINKKMNEENNCFSDESRNNGFISVIYENNTADNLGENKSKPKFCYKSWYRDKIAKTLY